MQKSISLLILSLLLSLTTIAQESIHDLFKLLDDSDVELLQNKVDAAHAQIDKDFHLVLYSMSNPQVVQSTESIASSSTNSIYLVINFAELYENEAYVFISPDLSDTYSEEFLAEVADEVMMSELDFISLEGDIKLTFIAGIDAFLNAKTPVTFTVHDEQNYGFDLYDNTPALEDDYPLLEALEDTPYRIAWKSLPTLGFDKAITEMKDGSLIPDNIQWKDENGIVIATTDVLDSDGTQKQLFLSGSAGNTDTKEIHAIQSTENDYGQSEEQIIGQLNLISYDEKDLNIVLVPVNTATVSNALSLANDLQNIFDPAIINVHLTLHDGISVSDFDDIMDDEDSGFLADYTDEMQDIISTFKRNNNITNKTYYLFVVQDAEDPNLEGFMPRNRKYGFLFENNIGGDEAFVRTVAHELGHGAYHLEHPFEEYAGSDEGLSENLMNYGSGTRLRKYQWDYMDDPVFVLPWSGGDEEGASEDITPTWRLKIYSPQVSRQMRIALNDRDVIEQRRLSYWALNNTFDNPWAFNMGGEYYGTATNRAAELIKYEPDHVNFEGLQLVLYDYYDENECITADSSRAVVINSSEEHFFRAGLASEYADDAGYPVDIFLWDSNYEFCDGSYFYDEFEFIGYYAEGLIFNNGKGVIVGRMKGYGYLEYFVNYSDGYNYIPGVSAGVVLGNFNEQYADYPNDFPSGATPATFVGSGITASIEGITRWNSYDPDDNSIYWQGEAYSYFGLSITLALNFSNIAPEFFAMFNWAANDFINFSGFTTETRILNYPSQGGWGHTFYNCSNIEE